MNRDQMTAPQIKILDVLESASVAPRAQECGGWVRGNALETAVGRRFGARLWEMAPEKPTIANPGLGFKIARRRARDASNDWEYRLEGYPPGWKDAIVNFIGVIVGAMPDFPDPAEDIQDHPRSTRTIFKDDPIEEKTSTQTSLFLI